MGNSSSASEQCVVDTVMVGPFKAQVDAFIAGGVSGAGEGLCSGVSGGAEGSIFGGKADAMQDYGNSKYSEAKEKLIRNIAEEVFKALKLKSAGNAQTAPLNSVVSHLRKIVPNPKKGSNFKESFNKSASTQEGVCNAIANALNKHYGSNLIDTSAPVAERCRRVAEVMDTLFMNVHTEFMTVSGDILRTFRNMQVLQDALDASYKKQTDIIASSGDESLKERSGASADLTKKLREELDRQMAMVSNMLNVVVGPSGKSLIGLLEENKDFSGLVKDIGGDSVGTSDFGKKLAYMLSGVSSVAYAADVSRKALKKLGMSVAEFKAAKNPSALRLAVYNHIQKQKPNAKELDGLMAAAELLQRHSYDHTAVAKVIGGLETMGGDCGCEDGMVAGGADSDDELDDTMKDQPTYWSKKSLVKKINKKRKYRKIMLRDFHKNLKAHMRVIVESANVVAQKIGNDIPISDDLDRFIKIFGSLESLSSDNLPKILSGYRKDVAAKTHRDQFMNQYDLACLSMEPLLKGSAAKPLKSMQSAIKAMVKSIDNFADNIVGALTEIHVDRPEDLSHEVRRVSSDFFGSADNDEGGTSAGAGSFVAFEKVVSEMTYRYSIANIKANLKVSAQEIEHFGKDYENVLGEEAGWLIDQINKECNDRVKALEADEGVYASLAAVAGGGAANTAKALTKENLKSIWKQQAKAKVGMVEAAQAVDLYMKSFANGMARDPDSIGSIVKMLNQVDFVANWFNERSGDNLAAIYESFPSGYNNAAAGDALANELVDSNKLPTEGDNYYKWIDAKAKGLAGNPFLGRSLDNAEAKKRMSALRKQTMKAVKSMRALENILSTFSSVGKKFGSIDPQADTFMTPGQIFNSLSEYVCESAYASEFLPRTADVASVKYRCAVADADVVGANVPAVAAPEQHRAPDAHADSRATAANDNGAVLANVPAASVGILSGVDQRADAGGAPAANLAKVSAVAMCGLPDDSRPGRFWDYHAMGAGRDTARTSLSGWRDDFFDTDLLFQMTVKSVVAKVFTMVDAYRLFNRPTKDPESHDSLNPIRTILGGAQDSTPKIESGAIELYLRLPLLAEWYRDNFGFNARSTGNARNEWEITIVPNIDGTWSGLMNLIFDKASYVSEGNYSENVVRKLIGEINKIYRSYKSRNSNVGTRTIINSFVLEMNRVLGFLKRDQIRHFLDEKRAHLNETDSEDDNRKNFLDYDILDSEDTFGRNPAPSDRFRKSELSGSSSGTKAASSMSHLLQSVETLRKKIYTDFRAVDSNNIKHFTETLRNYSAEVANADSDSARYQVILKMVQGTNKLVNQSADKLIMVHEAVATPLLVAHQVVAVLRKFNSHLHGTSLANIAKWNALRISDDRAARAAAVIAANADEGINVLAGILDTRDRQQASFKEALKVMYPNAKYQWDDLVAALMQHKLSAAHSGYLVAAGMNNIAAIAAADGDITGAEIASQDIVRDTLAAVLDLCTLPNSLVQCSVGTSGAVNIDFSRAEDLVTDLIAQVKRNIHKLRYDFTDKATLAQYEDKDHPASVHALDEQVQLLFKNRDGAGLDVAVSECLKTTLEKAGSGRLFADANANADIETLDFAVAPLAYYARTAADTNAGNNAGSLPAHDRHANDLTSFPFNVIPVTPKESRDAAADAALGKMNEHAVGTDITANNSTVAAFNALTDAPGVMLLGKDLNGWNLDEHRGKSLLLSFNKILHMYLKDSIDESNTRIYTALFETFMHGAASNEVVQDGAFPNVLEIVGATPFAAPAGDDATFSAYFGNAVLGQPKPNSVVFKSTALAMKSMLSTMDRQLKRKAHAYDTLSEVPEYVKDRLKTNLPHYCKLFDMVAKRAELLRKIIDHTAVKDNFAATQSGVAVLVASAANAAGIMDALADDPTAGDSAANATRLSSLLGNIVNRATGIKKCADKVYKELQDTAPYFMDTSADFVSDFKQRHGELPIMPASNVTCVMNAYASSNNTLLLPSNANGSSNYKFNRASRLLLGRSDVEPQLDHMPGAKDIFNRYASSGGKRSQITSAEYSNTVLTSVKLARYLGDGGLNRLFDRADKTHHTFEEVREAAATAAGNAGNGNVGQDARDAADAVVNPVVNAAPDAYLDLASLLGVGGADAAAVAAAIRAVPVPDKYVSSSPFGAIHLAARLGDDAKMPSNFQSADSMDAVYELAENSNQEAGRGKLALAVSADASVGMGITREQLRIHNILDMNIVPVNVHAFMREVPFVNLLNYSHTFDRMVHEFVVPSSMRSRHNSIEASTEVSSTRELMVKLLAHPMADLTAMEYYGVLGSLFNGNDNMKLGRPRYLSDQLWHKVLMTSSAQDVVSASPEAGPAAYEARRAVVRRGDPRVAPGQAAVAAAAGPLVAVGNDRDNTLGTIVLAANVLVLESEAIAVAFPGFGANASSTAARAAVDAAEVAIHALQLDATQAANGVMGTARGYNDALAANDTLDTVMGNMQVGDLRFANDTFITNIAADVSAGQLTGGNIDNAGARTCEAAVHSVVSKVSEHLDAVDSSTDAAVVATRTVAANALLLSNLRDKVNTFAAALGALENHQVRAPGRPALELASLPVSTAGLKYWNGKKWTSTNANIAPTTALYLAELGKARFDTKLCRNLTWLVQCQRVMRKVMSDHLSWINTPVVRGLPIADDSVTEYEANEAYDGDVFNGASRDWSAF